MRRAIIGAAVAALTTMCLASAGEAKAPGSNGRISYSQALPDGGALVLTARPDGTDVHQVPMPYLNEDFGRAVWSPNSSKLLISNVLRFDPNGDLLPFRPATVNPDGSDYNLLTMPWAPFDSYCTTWSPDGTRILCGLGGDQPGIFSIRASDGADPIRLTSTRFADQPGDYSPDGLRIVFVRFDDGVAPVREDVDNKTALFVMNADGTGQRQITPFGIPAAHEAAGATWSPDGALLISATRDGRLFTVRPDGSRFSPIRVQLGTGNYFAFAPVFAPDGTRIVFSAQVSGAADVYSANPDGSDLRQLTTSPLPDRFPDWGSAA
jgi:Tol biopolymer transport system component